MKKKSLFILVFLLFVVFLSYNLPAKKSTGSKIKGIEHEKTGNTVNLTIDWQNFTKAKKTDIPRINSNTYISIRVKNFNFFQYKLQYTIDEKVVESYKKIEKLWAELFGIPGITKIPRAVDKKEDFAYWAKELKKTENKIMEYLADISNNIAGKEETRIVNDEEKTVKVDKTIIDVKKNREKIESMRDDLINDKMKLGKLSARVLERQVKTQDDLKNYEKVEARHAKVIEKINSFINMANLTLEGDVKNIGKKKSGTYITVIFTAVEKSPSHPEQTKPKMISYFVHSPFPVIFHVGYAYSGLKDIEFKKVRALESADLFSQVKDEKGTDEFVAFLSWEPKIKMFKNTSKFSLALTLGTDVSSPGEKIYAGASLKLLSRVFLTGGFVSGEVAEAKESNKIVDKIVDEVTGKTNTRNLYTTITLRRNWEWFIGISFSFL